MNTNMLLYNKISKSLHEMSKKIKSLTLNEDGIKELKAIKKVLETLFSTNKEFFDSNPELRRKYKHLKTSIEELLSSNKIVQP